MRSIFIKEINSFFSSIVGYVALLVFLVACGLFLWILPTENNLLKYGYASLAVVPAGTGCNNAFPGR
jgi:ABC-2 type transport system permease protein